MGLDFTFDTRRSFILYSRSRLSATTTGTTEEILGTITVPANTFTAGSGFSGIRVTLLASAAANTNSKSVRLRVGGIGGTAVCSQTADATSNNRFSLSTELMPVASDELSGVGQSTRKTGTSFIFTVAAITGLDFTAPITIVATGETPTAAGDLTLTAFRAELFPSVP